MRRTDSTRISRSTSEPVRLTRRPTWLPSCSVCDASTTSSDAAPFFRKPDFQLRDFGAADPDASFSRNPSSVFSRQPVTVTAACCALGDALVRAAGATVTSEMDVDTLGVAARATGAADATTSDTIVAVDSVLAFDCCWRAAIAMPPAMTQMTTITVAFGPSAEVRPIGFLPATGFFGDDNFFAGISNLPEKLTSKGCRHRLGKGSAAVFWRENPAGSPGVPARHTQNCHR